VTNVLIALFHAMAMCTAYSFIYVWKTVPVAFGKKGSRINFIDETDFYDITEILLKSRGKHPQSNNK